MLTLQVRRVLSPRATWKKNLVHRTQQTIKLLNIMKTLRKPSYHRTPLPASLSLSTPPPLFSESLWVSPAHPRAPPLPLHHTSFSLSISCSKTRVTQLHTCMPSTALLWSGSWSITTPHGQTAKLHQNELISSELTWEKALLCSEPHSNPELISILGFSSQHYSRFMKHNKNHCLTWPCSAHHLGAVAAGYLEPRQPEEQVMLYQHSLLGCSVGLTSPHEFAPPLPQQCCTSRLLSHWC